MSKVLLLIFCFFSLQALATVTAGKPDCPIQFEGKVKQIIAPVGASSAFSKQKIVFTNLQTFKGDAPETVTLDVLKNGPFEIEQGEDYQVQVRDGKLCWIEKSHQEIH